MGYIVDKNKRKEVEKSKLSRDFSIVSSTALGLAVGGPVGAMAGFIIGSRLCDGDARTPHRKFEDLAEKYLKRTYVGFEIKPQHASLASGTIVDFFGRNKRTGERFTAEVKHVKAVTKTHIEQAANQYPRSPSIKLLILNRDAKISDSLKDYAERKGVKIVPLRSDYH